MSIAKRGADGFYALRLANLMRIPFTKWKAFELGLIDANGQKLRDAETPFEKSNWTLFHVTAANLKKIVNKLPGGKTMLTFGASFLLLKELAATYELSDDFITETSELHEAMVAGDAGGDPDMIAKGENSGPITSPGPKVLGKKKRKVKRFNHYKDKDSGKDI
ncbi:hypothetical protein VPHD479_0201 [Vibrio phage D479]